MFTPEQFRAVLPEFGNPTTYPDVQINFWITAAGPLLDTNRWDTLIDLGTALFVAHHLVLAARDQKAGNAKGGIPGQPFGIMTSKAVDKVSASYDVVPLLLSDAAFWNMSTYGVRFLTYARMVGAGGVQLAGGFGCGAAPWTGPFF